MNSQQKQKSLSWSDWHEELFSNLTDKQRQFMHKNNKDVYELYRSGRSAQEVVQYLVAGVI